MGLAAAATLQAADARTALLGVALFSAVALPCILLWAAFGVVILRVLRTARARSMFDLAIAIALVATALMMLAGFETATHGKILLNGVSINNIPPHKRGIGMVFQNYALFPHMTVAENLSFPLEVRKLGKSEREEKVRRALDMVQMGDFGNRRPAQLSGGQQQRVTIARSFVHDPAVIFADEATGNLDSQTSDEIIDLLLNLNSERGVTMMLVTHDSEIADRCSRVLVMQDGRIVEDRRTEEEE